MYIVASLFFTSAVFSLFKFPYDVILTLILAGIFYPFFFADYPEGVCCNICGKQLFLPWGADHLWCALRYHPLQSALGRGYIILYALGKIFFVKGAENFLKIEEALRARIREQAIQKGLRES